MLLIDLHLGAYTSHTSLQVLSLDPRHSLVKTCVIAAVPMLSSICQAAHSPMALQLTGYVLPGLARTAFRAFSSVSAAAASGGVISHKVGFIGLGKMGSRMVNQLLDNGVTVVAYDRNRLALNRAREVARAHPSGTLEERNSPADVAADPEVPCVITMLANASDAKECYLGRQGLFKVPGGPRSSLFIDFTTIDPGTTRQLAASAGMLQLAHDAPHMPGLLLEDGKPHLLDAPVSGAIVGAQAGTLTFMLGGNKAAADAAMPILRTMGSNILYCGDHGAGLAAKMCSLLVVACSMAAVSEALAAGRRLGLAPEVLTRVLNAGAGRCWAAEVYNPVPGVIANEELPSNRGYRAGLPTSVVSQQLDMLVEAARVAKSPVPLTRHVQALYERIAEEGLGDKDFSSIFRYIYGSGCASNSKWKEGDQLFSAQAP